MCIYTRIQIFRDICHLCDINRDEVIKFTFLTPYPAVVKNGTCSHTRSEDKSKEMSDYRCYEHKQTFLHWPHLPPRVRAYVFRPGCLATKATLFLFFFRRDSFSPLCSGCIVPGCFSFIHRPDPCLPTLSGPHKV